MASDTPTSIKNAIDWRLYTIESNMREVLTLQEKLKSCSQGSLGTTIKVSDDFNLLFRRFKDNTKN